MWNQWVVILLGIWLMASPDIFNYEGPERINDHIVAPLIVSAATIAIAESTRTFRWINVALGCWLILAPAILGFSPLHIGVRSSLIGVVILSLSLIEGPHKEQLGGGWSRLWTPQKLVKTRTQSDHVLSSDKEEKTA